MLFITSSHAIEYNEKDRSLALIIVCKVLTVFVTLWEQYKIIGEMLSTFEQP